MDYSAGELSSALPSGISGVLPVYKPRDMVSKDVSRWLTRRFGKSFKIGHVGTLDPMAEGVLPILIGQATRVQDYLLEQQKTYVCKFNMGVETDTLDATGCVVRKHSPLSISQAQVEALIPSFCGEISQIPPLYSAVKLAGRPLYSYARSATPLASDALEKKIRKVQIYTLDLLSFNKTNNQLEISMRVTCSKGTYIRSLGRDFAQALGTYATLIELVRVQCSGFTLTDCLSLDDLEKISHGDLSSKDHGGPVQGSLASIPLVPIASLKIPLPHCHLFSQGDVLRLLSGAELLMKENEFQIRGKLALTPLRDAQLGGPVRQVEVLLLDSTGLAFGLGTFVISFQSIRIGLKRRLVSTSHP